MRAEAAGAHLHVEYANTYVSALQILGHPRRMSVYLTSGSLALKVWCNG